MPVQENYIHSDVPHEKTVQSPDFVYSACHNKPRPTHFETYYQDGWTPDGRRNMIPCRTEFIRQGCTHIGRAQDSACRGCEHQHRPTALKAA